MAKKHVLKSFQYSQPSGKYKLRLFCGSTSPQLEWLKYQVVSNDEDMREEPVLAAGGAQTRAAIMEINREIPQKAGNRATA